MMERGIEKTIIMMVRGTWFALLGMIFFVPVPFIDRVYPYVTCYLFFLLIAAFVVVGRHGGFPVRKRTIVVLVASLLGLGINVLWAQEKSIALRRYCFLVLPGLAVVVLTALLFRQARARKQSLMEQMAVFISICGFLVAGIGVIEFLTKTNFLYGAGFSSTNPFYTRYVLSPGGFVRPIATQFNPACLGTCLLFSLPFSFFTAAEMKGFFRWTGILSALLSFFVLMLTFSRGSLIGFAAMVAVYCVIKRKMKMLLLFSAVAVLLSWCAHALPYPFVRLSPQWIFGNGGTGMVSAYRVDRAKAALTVITEHPLTGIGFDHVRIRFDEFYLPGKRTEPMDYEHRIMDNMYLTILAEAGIPGLIIVIMLLVYIIKKAVQSIAYYRARDDSAGAFVLAGFLAFVGLSVAMAGYDMLYWVCQYLYYAVAIGLILAVQQDTKGP